MHGGWGSDFLSDIEAFSGSTGAVVTLANGVAHSKGMDVKVVRISGQVATHTTQDRNVDTTATIHAGLR